MRYSEGINLCEPANALTDWANEHGRDMCKQTLIANIRVAAFWTLLAAPQWVFAEEPLQLAATVQWMGQIESRRLDESSGLAASQHYEDILWSINDSGSDAELFALTIRGEHVGRWSINLPTPSDWEAMDSFQWRGKNYLLLADIGDNFATRGSVSYTILAEPRRTRRGRRRLRTK